MGGIITNLIGQGLGQKAQSAQQDAQDIGQQLQVYSYILQDPDASPQLKTVAHQKLLGMAQKHGGKEAKQALPMLGQYLTQLAAPSMIQGMQQRQRAAASARERFGRAATPTPGSEYRQYIQSSDDQLATPSGATDESSTQPPPATSAAASADSAPPDTGTPPAPSAPWWRRGDVMPDLTLGTGQYTERQVGPYARLERRPPGEPQAAPAQRAPSGAYLAALAGMAAPQAPAAQPHHGFRYKLGSVLEALAGGYRSPEELQQLQTTGAIQRAQAQQQLNLAGQQQMMDDQLRRIDEGERQRLFTADTAQQMRQLVIAGGLGGNSQAVAVEREKLMLQRQFDEQQRQEEVNRLEELHKQHMISDDQFNRAMLQVQVGVKAQDEKSALVGEAKDLQWAKHVKAHPEQFPKEDLDLADDIEKKWQQGTESRQGLIEERKLQTQKLPDEAVDFYAEAYLKTGKMPTGAARAWGRAAMQQIMAEIPEVAARQGLSVGDLIAQQADVGAMTKALGTMETQYALVSTFEKTAQKNLDRAVDAARNISDLGVPLLNAPWREAQRMLQGKPELARYTAARDVAFTEVSRVLSGSMGNGAVSDKAREEADNILSKEYTLAQLLEVADLLKKDMETRTTNMQDTISGIRQKIAGGGKAGGGGAGGVIEYERGPDGKIRPKQK